MEIFITEHVGHFRGSKMSTGCELPGCEVEVAEGGGRRCARSAWVWALTKVLIGIILGSCLLFLSTFAKVQNCCLLRESAQEGGQGET